MEQRCKKDGARRLRVAAGAFCGALALGLAACGQEAPSVQAAKPSVQPVEQSAAKAPETASPATPKPEATAPAPTEPALQPSGDAALATKVKAVLEADPALRALAVDVTAAGGAVTLFGTADSTANRDRAAKVAAGVPGVTSVQNQIVIVRGS